MRAGKARLKRAERGGEVRSPKSEVRSPKEGRNPKSEEARERCRTGRCAGAGLASSQQLDCKWIQFPNRGIRGTRGKTHPPGQRSARFTEPLAISIAHLACGGPAGPGLACRFERSEQKRDSQDKIREIIRIGIALTLLIRLVRRPSWKRTALLRRNPRKRLGSTTV